MRRGKTRFDRLCVIEPGPNRSTSVNHPLTAFFTLICGREERVLNCGACLPRLGTIHNFRKLLYLKQKKTKRAKESPYLLKLRCLVSFCSESERWPPARSFRLPGEFADSQGGTGR